MSYASLLVRKLHSCGGVTSKTYKPTFYGSYLSRNMSYGSTANLWVFYLPRWRYSYSTWSSMTELPCQCLNTETSARGNRSCTTETLSLSYTFCLYIRLVVTLLSTSLIIDEDKLLLNSISDVQQQHINQHSLPSQTSVYHLKLWLRGKQTVQHISWSQGHSTSSLISESILQTSTLVWTTLDISNESCHLL